MATGEAQTVTGLATLLPGLSRAGAGPVGQADVDAALVLPLTAAGTERPVGALVLGTSPHLPLDEDHRIPMALAAGQVAATVTDAQAVAAERRRAEERARSELARAQFYADVAVTLQRAVLGPTVLPEGGALPLAVQDGCPRPEVEVALPAGSTVLLYTDGLVERRDVGLDEGIARAVDVLAEGCALGSAELGALLTRRLLGDGSSDDVAFVLFRCG